MPPNQIYGRKQRKSEGGGKENTTRRSREVFERDGYSTPRQAHSYPVQHLEAERSKCIGAAPNRNGTTQWIPTPDWSSRIGPMRLRPSKGNRQAFSLPMYEMGGTPNTNASAYRDKKGQPLFLFGRKSTIRPRPMGPRHSHRTTRHRDGTSTLQLTAANFVPQPLLFPD